MAIRLSVRSFKLIKIVVLVSLAGFGCSGLYAQPEGLPNANFADIFLFPAGNADEARCSFAQPNFNPDWLRLTARDNRFKVVLSEVTEPVKGDVFVDTELMSVGKDNTTVLNQLRIVRQTDNSFNGIEFELPSDNSAGVIATSSIGFDVVGLSLEEEFPLVITSGAKSGSIVMRENGVGIGRVMPEAALHVFAGAETEGETSDDSIFENAKVIVENQLPTVGFREMFALINNGASRFTMENTDNNTKWGFASDALGRFTFSVESSDGPEFAITPSGRVTMGPGSTQNFDLRPNGNLIIAGTLIQSSDENLKSDFRDVDADTVLDKVSAMPIANWTFNFDSPDVRHIGPTAQDFRESFELGMNDTTIAPIDGIGVSLVSIKALNQKIRTQQNQLDEQAKLIAELSERLAKLETSR